MSDDKANEPEKRPKCLVVDDDHDVCESISLIVAEDFEVDSTMDGFSAAKLCSMNHYDVILCDMCMPMIDGLSLLQEFQRRNVATPFVLMTGNLDEDVLKKALAMGVYNIIEKPFTGETLITKLNMAIALQKKKEYCSLNDQERGYVYDMLKSHYYDVNRILQLIDMQSLPLDKVKEELLKKEATGQCMFDYQDIMQQKAN